MPTWLMREVTKGMPEDIIAENLSKSVAVWGIAFRIGVPETNMLECGKI